MTGIVLVMQLPVMTAVPPGFEALIQPASVTSAPTASNCTYDSFSSVYGGPQRGSEPLV